MSYANVTMYAAVLPTYSSKQDKDKVIKADDPRNRERVRDILFG